MNNKTNDNLLKSKQEPVSKYLKLLEQKMNNHIIENTSENIEHPIYTSPISTLMSSSNSELEELKETIKKDFDKISVSSKPVTKITNTGKIYKKYSIIENTTSDKENEENEEDDDNDNNSTMTEKIYPFQHAESKIKATLDTKQIKQTKHCDYCTQPFSIDDIISWDSNVTCMHCYFWTHYNEAIREEADGKYIKIADYIIKYKDDHNIIKCYESCRSDCCFICDYLTKNIDSLSWIKDFNKLRNTDTLDSDSDESEYEIEIEI